MAREIRLSAIERFEFCNPEEGIKEGDILTYPVSNYEVIPPRQLVISRDSDKVVTVGRLYRSDELIQMTYQLEKTSQATFLDHKSRFFITKSDPEKYAASMEILKRAGCAEN